MIDTHVHYGLKVYDNCLDQIERADRLAGVEYSICLPVEYKDNFTLMKKTADFSNMSYAIGIHPLHLPKYPHNNKKNFSLKREEADLKKRLDIMTGFEANMKALNQLIIENRKKVVAIGETGIDIHNEAGMHNLMMQKVSLTEHLILAQKHKLPVVFHIRGEGAIDKVVETIRNGRLRRMHIRGVFHCFYGSEEEMNEALRSISEDLVFGIGGMITYQERGKELREHLRTRDAEDVLSKIVLETDAPFLVPQTVPLSKSLIRDNLNSSARLPEIVKALSTILGVSGETVVQRTNENARRVFAI